MGKLTPVGRAWTEACSLFPSCPCPSCLRRLCTPASSVPPPPASVPPTSSSLPPRCPPRVRTPEAQLLRARCCRGCRGLHPRPRDRLQSRRTEPQEHQGCRAVLHRRPHRLYREH